MSVRKSVTCPSCGLEMRLPAELLNQTLRCPSCTRPFIARGGGEAVLVAEREAGARRSSEASGESRSDYQTRKNHRAGGGAPESRRIRDDPTAGPPKRGSPAECRANWRLVKLGLTFSFISF